MVERDYCLELLNAINDYSPSIEKTDNIRKLICYISETPLIEKTQDVQELITEGARMIRVFGYYHLNGIDPDALSDADDRTAIKNRLVFDTYRTKSGKNDKVTYLDKQQKDIIDTFNKLEHKRIFVSAPTSFGKTHILKEILFLNAERYNNIVLIFPTVALLTENMDSITEFVDEHDLDYAVSNNFQPSKKIDDGKGQEVSNRNIYILTPERAIKIFEDQPVIKIDFFFFDEVYKIDEDFNSNDDYEGDSESKGAKPTEDNHYKEYSRAVAFRIVLYFLAKNTPEFYLAGPYIDLDKLKLGMERFFQAFDVKKIQINTEATLKSFYHAWNKDVKVQNDIEGESSIKLEGEFSTVKDKVKCIIEYIQSENWGQTLVYSDIPYRTMERAIHLGRQNNTLSKDLQILIDHLQRRYSVDIKESGKNSADEWSLLKVLNNSIGVHHGKLPRYLQKEILRLFNREDIHILFCTSTLIEGVNTKAKNMIISSGNIRKSQPLNQFDIKNIIGRAGRYHHHFMGRVFFIEEEQNGILKGPPQQLNFPLFDNVPLSAEDVDNVSVNELDQSKCGLKYMRDNSLCRDILPDLVFYKNRLFDRKLQEELLKKIASKFNEFQNILCGDTYSILESESIKLCLGVLNDSGIITMNQKDLYYWIIKNYYRRGVLGLIDYELNYNRKTANVDAGYNSAFDKRRSIIEYQFPRYFFLIEALYNHLCETNHKENMKVDLSKLCRFFETGAKSVTGQHLIEYGMPSGIVKEIERKYRKMMFMSLEDGKLFLLKDKEEIINKINMDAFESREFRKIITFIC